MDMDKLDSFESVFRSAVKEAFCYQSVELKKIVLIDDNPKTQAEKLLERVKKYLQVVGNKGEEPDWVLVHGDEFDEVDKLLERIDQEKPDMVVAYRHLKQPEKSHQHSIGVYMDMLTQSTNYPVLLLPYFEDKALYDKTMVNTNSVTVVADHITGDHNLLNWGLFFTEKSGDLYLTHIEDSATFERYLGVIGKIKELPTDTAREKILHQLMKEPQDYIQSCIQVIENEKLEVTIHPVVKLGHHVADYKSHITDHQVDLLIMNTKEEEQLAMHGMAYSLAVELNHLPLLLL